MQTVAILRGMKLLSPLPLLLGLGILSAQLPVATAQDALQQARTAANVATHVQYDSIDGYAAIYVSPQNWQAATADKNLGPFLEAQEASPSRSAVCLFSKARNTGICVYFDGGTAYGVTALVSDWNHPYTVAGVSDSFQQATPDLLEKASERISLAPTTIKLDSGQTLPAYAIKVGAAGAP